MSVEIDFLKEKIRYLEDELQIYYVLLSTTECLYIKENNIIDPKVFNIKVVDLEITVRSSNCLKFFTDIVYVGDLVQMKKKDIRLIKGLGSKSINELMDVLDNYNLTFGMEIPEWVRPTHKES